MAVGWSLCSSESPAIPGPGVPQPLVSLRERTVARAKPAGVLSGVGFGRLLGFCFFIGTGYLVEGGVRAAGSHAPACPSAGD